MINWILSFPARDVRPGKHTWTLVQVCAILRALENATETGLAQKKMCVKNASDGMQFRS